MYIDFKNGFLLLHQKRQSEKRRQRKSERASGKLYKKA